MRAVRGIVGATAGQDGRMSFSWLYRLRVRLARINRNAKCPRCGWRSGRIEWDEKTGRILHQCMECRANWMERPIVAVEGKP
jgi:predicted Zn-ribbon and HTH transcriptional regulator